MRFLRNGVTDSINIQWRPKDGSADWVTVGTGARGPARLLHRQATSPLAVPGEWRAVLLIPDRQVGQFSLATDAR